MVRKLERRRAPFQIGSEMMDVRCPRCGKKLGEMGGGSVALKCPRCKVSFSFKMDGKGITAIASGPRKPKRNASRKAAETR